MKKKSLRALALVLTFLVLLALPSCRNQVEIPYSYTNITTWGELFDAYWNKMNTNYIFWSIDYDQGSRWDECYDFYKPLFDKLGKIEMSSTNTATQRAMSYFFDITDNLSDGHYALTFKDLSGNYVASFNPYINRLMRRLGYDEGQIFRFISSYTPTSTGRGSYSAMTDEEYAKLRDYLGENLNNVIRNTFKRSDIIPSSGFKWNTTGTEKVDGYFENFGYVTSSSVSMVLGRTNDGIVYFSLSQFNLSAILTSQEPSYAELKGAINDLIAKFHALLSESFTKGVIIDLRGNPGGYIVDTQILWPAFTPAEDVTFYEYRAKSGNNRLDYGSWVPLKVPMSSAAYDKSKPIVLLVNGYSVSCSEMSTFFFMALRDKYGYDVTLIGDTTAGGTGFLIAETDQVTLSGSVKLEPYISLMNTPSGQVRYIDGTMYEGVGIAPDIFVEFDSARFASGDDQKLDRALSFLRSKF